MHPIGNWVNRGSSLGLELEVRCLRFFRIPFLFCGFAKRNQFHAIGRYAGLVDSLVVCGTSPTRSTAKMIQLFQLSWLTSEWFTVRGPGLADSLPEYLLRYVPLSLAPNAGSQSWLWAAWRDTRVLYMLHSGSCSRGCGTSKARSTRKPDRWK